MSDVTQPVKWLLALAVVPVAGFPTVNAMAAAHAVAGSPSGAAPPEEDELEDAPLLVEEEEEAPLLLLEEEDAAPLVPLLDEEKDAAPLVPLLDKEEDAAPLPPPLEDEEEDAAPLPPPLEDEEEDAAPLLEKEDEDAELLPDEEEARPDEEALPDDELEAAEELLPLLSPAPGEPPEHPATSPIATQSLDSQRTLIANLHTRPWGRVKDARNLLCHAPAAMCKEARPHVKTGNHCHHLRNRRLLPRITAILSGSLVPEGQAKAQLSYLQPHVKQGHGK